MRLGWITNCFKQDEADCLYDLLEVPGKINTSRSAEGDRTTFGKRVDQNRHGRVIRCRSEHGRPMPRICGYTYIEKEQVI